MNHSIITDFERPPHDLVAAVAKQHVGVAGYAAGPRQVMHPAIKPLSSDWRICGPAFTVRPENWDDRLCSELAPKYCQRGDIIIVDAGGNTQTGVWGLSMSKSAALAGTSDIVQ